MDSNNVKDLIMILEDQNKIYEALIDLSKEIKESVKANDVKEIDILVKVESALTMKFSVLENKRKSVSKAVQREFEIPEELFNISVLKKYLNKEEIEKIEKAQKNLVESMKNLDEINSSNNMLIKSRLDWIDLSLKLMGESKKQNYNKNRQTEKNSKIVDEII
jgi:hypothetical protein